jgi:hypothetical protein
VRVDHEVGDGREVRQIAQRHPGRRCELDLAAVATYERVGRRHPRGVVDLTAVDRHRAVGRGTNEEPRGKPTRRADRRRPVRDPRELPRLHSQVGFLHGFPDRGAPCRVLRARGTVAVLVVDPAAREHPHATERELRVLVQHQRLEPGVAVAHEHDGCSRDDGVVGLVVAEPGLETARHGVGDRGSRPAAR